MSAATHVAASSSAAPAAERARQTRGARTTRALTAPIPISTVSEYRVPIQGIRTMLKARAPTIAPPVFAAYTRPTSRPGSPPRGATAASARGKLAPHSSAAGSTAHRQRTISSWKVYQRLVDRNGLIGQYGRESEGIKEVQGTVGAGAIWHR